MNFPAMIFRSTFVCLCMLFSVSIFAAETRMLAYVANAGNNHVQIIDTGSGSTVNKLYTGAAPWRLVKSPDGKKLLVQHWYAETTAVVNLASNSVEKVLPTRGPGVFSPKGDRLYAHSWPNTQLDVYDTRSYKHIKQQSTEDKMVYDMIFWGDLHIAKGQYDPVARVKREVFDFVRIAKIKELDAVSAMLQTGTSPGKLVLDPSGEFLLTANFDGSDVSILNKLSDGRRISLSPGPRDIVFSKDGKHMIVICWPRGARESQIYTLGVNFAERPWPSFKAEMNKTVKGGLTAAALGADGNLYALDRLNRSLLVLNAATLDEIKRIPVGDEPLAFVLRQVSAPEAQRLAQKTPARKKLEQVIARIKAQSPAFSDASFTETSTLENSAQSDDAEAKAKAGLKVTGAIKTEINMPDTVRQEMQDGSLRLAQGGRSLSITKQGRFKNTPRQELLHVLFTVGGLSSDEALRQLAGDVPGSPFLRNGIALDVVRETTEKGHKFIAIGASGKGEPVSQLWVDAASGLPADLVEQFPVTRTRNPHKPEAGFQGVSETKLHYHNIGGRMFPTALTRYLDGKKVSEVEISDIKFDQKPAPGRFDLAQLGGLAKPVKIVPKSIKSKEGGPGLAVASQGTAHVDTLFDERPDYSTSPPTSGHHTRYMPDLGVHAIPLPPEEQVGALINGVVLLQYNCPQACPELARQLEGMADHYEKIIVAPYPFMDSKIALTAWQRIETLPAFDEKRIKVFIEAYAGKKHPHNKEDLPDADEPEGAMMMPPNHPPMQGGGPPMMPQR